MSRAEAGTPGCNSSVPHPARAHLQRDERCRRLALPSKKWVPAGPDTADTPGFSSTRTNSLTDAVMSLPDVLRSRSAQLVGALELGAPLGRGSYGTVYKGVLWGLQVEDHLCVWP